VKNYNVSPVKIRKAGIEEMKSLKNQEMMAASRNAISKREQSASHKVLQVSGIARELSQDMRIV